MEKARVQPVSIVPIDDRDTVGDVCTSKQDAFARVWADTGNQSAAYRQAYDVHERTLPGTVWANASRIAALPCVRKRYDEYRQQLALETIISVRDALQWQLDIATADPNEVAYIAKRACRYCYGIDHAYQWVDDVEYMKACVAAIDKQEDVPLDNGGYGYTRAKDPALTCTVCLGDGFEEKVINDTRNLKGKARKLYKGYDIKNGETVVQMHDQKAAWEMVCRMLGAFNDKLDLRSPADRAAGAKMPEGINEQDAARAYLAMLTG